MIGLTLLATIVTVLHPIAWSVEEVRFAIGGAGRAGDPHRPRRDPAGEPDVDAQARPDHAGRRRRSRSTSRSGCSLLAAAVAGCFALAGRFGFGPLAPPLAPDDPARLAEPPAEPPPSWLRLGSDLGVPGRLAGHLPRAAARRGLRRRRTSRGRSTRAARPARRSSSRPARRSSAPGRRVTTGRRSGSSPRRCTTTTTTCARPTRRRRRGGPGRSTSSRSGSTRAASPGDTSAAIYDAGNIAIWWLGVPAMGFIAWQAFKRRSLGLAMIGGRLRLPVAVLVAHRPGDVPVPLLHERAVHHPRRSPTCWPSCGTAPRAGRGCWRGSRRPSR